MAAQEFVELFVRVRIPLVTHLNLRHFLRGNVLI